MLVPSQPHQVSYEKVRALIGKEWDPETRDGVSGRAQMKLRTLNPRGPLSPSRA